MDAHYWYGVASGVVISALLFIALDRLARYGLPKEPELPQTLRDYKARREQW